MVLFGSTASEMEMWIVTLMVHIYFAYSMQGVLPGCLKAEARRQSFTVTTGLAGSVSAPRVWVVTNVRMSLMLTSMN